MITLTERDLFVILAPLFKVPQIPESGIARFWSKSESGHENAVQRLRELCDAHLLRRHVAQLQAAPRVELFYFWTPGMPTPEFGALAWDLAQRWHNVEPRTVAFYTATDKAAKHYGRAIHNPLKSMSALSHNYGLGQCYTEIAHRYPQLVKGWVAEDVIASARGYGEKVVDACIVDSKSTPALALEFAGNGAVDGRLPGAESPRHFAAQDGGLRHYEHG